MATDRKPGKSTRDDVDQDWAIVQEAIEAIETVLEVLEHGTRHDELKKPIDVLRAVLERMK